MARIAVEDRRLQLVEATIRVMSEHGVAAATTRRIAAEANTTLATVHYCFESKQTLLREVITTIVGQLASSSVPELSNNRDLPTLVQELLEGLWAVIESEPQRQQLTYELTQFALREPDLADLARWQYELYYAECARILDAVAVATGWTWTGPVGCGGAHVADGDRRGGTRLARRWRRCPGTHGVTDLRRAARYARSGVIVGGRPPRFTQEPSAQAGRRGSLVPLGNRAREASPPAQQFRYPRQ